MNISNKLTFLRISLSFLCIGLILQNSLFSLLLAFFIFIFSSFTDLLDGYFARKKNLITDLGRIIDPIADKILILGVFLAFLQIKAIINVWMVIIIMLREFIITGLRLYGLNKGEVLEAKRWGKHKTASQVVAIVIIFISLILHKRFPQSYLVDFLYERVSHWVMWYVVIITLFSGVYYFWINRRTIKTF